MSRIFRIVGMIVLLGLGALAVGCCDSRAYLLPLEPPFDIDDRTRFEFAHVSDRKLTIADGSPKWDLGWYEPVTGEDRLIIITRIMSYSDFDYDGRIIANTHFDRELERIWITIPKGTRRGEPLMLEDLATRGLMGYEGRHESDRTFFRAPFVARGYLTPVGEQEGLPVIRYHMIIAPGRPFLREPWSLKGEQRVGLLKEVVDQRSH